MFFLHLVTTNELLEITFCVYNKTMPVNKQYSTVGTGEL